MAYIRENFRKLLKNDAMSPEKCRKSAFKMSQIML